MQRHLHFIKQLTWKSIIGVCGLMNNLCLYANLKNIVVIKVQQMYWITM